MSKTRFVEELDALRENKYPIGYCWTFGDINCYHTFRLSLEQLYSSYVEWLSCTYTIKYDDAAQMVEDHVVANSIDAAMNFQSFRDYLEDKYRDDAYAEMLLSDEYKDLKFN